MYVAFWWWWLSACVEQQAQEHDSDRDEEADGRVPDDSEAKDQVSNLLSNSEKVALDDFELLKVLGRGSFGKVCVCVVFVRAVMERSLMGNFIRLCKCARRTPVWCTP